MGLQNCRFAGRFFAAVTIAQAGRLEPGWRVVCLSFRGGSKGAHGAAKRRAARGGAGENRRAARAAQPERRGARRRAREVRRAPGAAQGPSTMAAWRSSSLGSRASLAEGTGRAPLAERSRRAPLEGRARRRSRGRRTARPRAVPASSETAARIQVRRGWPCSRMRSELRLLDRRWLTASPLSRRCYRDRIAAARCEAQLLRRSPECTRRAFRTLESFVASPVRRGGNESCS